MHFIVSETEKIIPVLLLESFASSLFKYSYTCFKILYKIADLCILISK